MFRSKVEAEEIIVPDCKLPTGWAKVKVQCKRGAHKGGWSIVVKR